MLSVIACLLFLILLCMFKPVRQIIGVLFVIFGLMLWWNWPSDTVTPQSTTATAQTQKAGGH
jgi:hypothetical protein